MWSKLKELAEKSKPIVDGVNWVKEKTKKSVETIKETVQDTKVDLECRIAARAMGKHLDKIEEEERRLEELAKKLGPYLQRNGY